MPVFNRFIFTPVYSIPFPPKMPDLKIDRHLDNSRLISAYLEHLLHNATEQKVTMVTTIGKALFIHKMEQVQQVFF